MGINDMTKGAALHQFFSSFSIPAYPSTSVPDNAVMPYLTYDYVVGAWEQEEVAITVNLWYYTESEAVPSAKANELSAAIGIGGKVIPCEDGYIWLKRGSPWCQSLSDETDSGVKRRYINVSAEYLTFN